MIADGVHQGYLEVRVVMATKKGQRPSMPARPWRKSAAPERRRDWVADIATMAQRPGAGRLAPSHQTAPVMSLQDFRDRVARERAEAVARARPH